MLHHRKNEHMIFIFLVQVSTVKRIRIFLTSFWNRILFEATIKRLNKLPFVEILYVFSMNFYGRIIFLLTYLLILFEIYNISRSIANST